MVTLQYTTEWSLWHGQRMPCILKQVKPQLIEWNPEAEAEILRLCWLLGTSIDLTVYSDRADTDSGHADHTTAISSPKPEFLPLLPLRLLDIITETVSLSSGTRNRVVPW